MLGTVRHTYPLRVMKKAEEEFVKYGSRGLLTRTRFDRFSVIRILLLLGFVFIINSLKNLIFGVRLFDNRLFDSRLFDNL